MDPITQQTVIAAAGAGGGDPVYVDDVFSTYLYEGTGSTQSINNGIDLAGEGGLVWIKNRETTGQDHALFDTERGAGYLLASNEANAQSLSTNRLSALNSNGFTVGTDNATNQSAKGIVSWSFRKAPGFFDVVTYTGNGTAGRTVAHNLGSVPGMIIVKCTNVAEPWAVYHRSLGNTKYLSLSETSGEQSSISRWNNTTPTSSVFTVGSDANVNQNTKTYVAYIFAHDDASFGTDEDESIIKCGTYSGSGSTDQTIDIGFEPQWILIKKTSGTAEWQLFDIMRGFGAPYSGNSSELIPTTSVAENAGTRIHVEANGFSFQGESSTRVNSSGDTYIYMAIRRPNKPPEAATEVFAMDYGNGSSTIPGYDSGFPVDFSIWKNPSTASAPRVATRLLGTTIMFSAVSDAESSEAQHVFDSNVGFAKDVASNNLAWMFKRAPGFFDVVAYSGAGGVVTHSHNLGVVPELMIIKSRSSVENWFTYHKDFASPAHHVLLNLNNAISTNSGTLNNTAPTASIFTVGNDNYSNDSTEKYVALLFATLPGISKVGSYTGTAATQNIDCGFTNGARFVLIKRTDGTGDWMLFDTTRGIVSGNDSTIWLNESDAAVTSTDYIDPYNAGFTLTSENDTNGGSDEYIFLAIA